MSDIDNTLKNRRWYMRQRITWLTNAIERVERGEPYSITLDVLKRNLADSVVMLMEMEET
ncbi:hypothetical protein [Paraburkholderia sp. BL10I2N1]|uniref:hypothetical protein n=1 Tax=Paraburkholderia sp. BL10I2N1 TaxID=1938796 RepID=UPI00105B7C2F|nr:hypothetical protein [Paraburkholderia sp. BL10I2N1]TDN70441.1 hypothetical protein B0G77_3915 [Paraburkholderia sp. BL10I2N1]